MGKSILAQTLLIEFCRDYGYTDCEFIGLDCVSATDKSGNRHNLGMNLYGDIFDIDSKEMIAVADTEHDLFNKWKRPKTWTLAEKEER